MLQHTRNVTETQLRIEGNNQLIILKRHLLTRGKSDVNLLGGVVDRSDFALERPRSGAKTANRIDDTPWLHLAAHQFRKERMKEELAFPVDHGDRRIRVFVQQTLQLHGRVNAGKRTTQDYNLARFVRGHRTPPSPLPVGNESTK